MGTDEFVIVKFPKSRIATFDVGKIGRSKHHVCAFIEVDVTQNWRDNRALWCTTVGFVILPVFQVSRIKKLANQIDEPVILNFLSQDI